MNSFLGYTSVEFSWDVSQLVSSLSRYKYYGDYGDGAYVQARTEREACDVARVTALDLDGSGPTKQRHFREFSLSSRAAQ